MKKEKILAFRANKEDLDFILSESKKVGKNMSEFLRERLLADKFAKGKK